MDDDAREAAMAQINAGAEVPAIDPQFVEASWDVLATLPPERRRNAAIGLGAVAGRGLESLPPEQEVALLIRITLLNALSECGVLNDYLSENTLKRKLMTAVASVPFTKNDLAEALSQRIFREATPEVAEKARREMIEAGLDPDFPGIARRLTDSLR